MTTLIDKVLDEYLPLEPDILEPFELLTEVEFKELHGAECSRNLRGHRHLLSYTALPHHEFDLRYPGAAKEWDEAIGELREDLKDRGLAKGKVLWHVARCAHCQRVMIRPGVVVTVTAGSGVSLSREYAV